MQGRKKTQASPIVHDETALRLLREGRVGALEVDPRIFPGPLTVLFESPACMGHALPIRRAP